ncbi:MAG: DUF1987 domain-containing protein [Bacteroidetes bacterium]|jgi:hypothetical protein|nr:DUF1987 domain-containing protein [Bacteroidota bacterium]MBV6460045.1 hypothetical protein [Flavobacteriales bacterium]WKZ76663.1 MAG: DUF1987 domain-containing protein [Vicingaceae bacterium]MCL4816395.1 SiaC family regulatory phosphoprotein [Flavobacteriales bacterium]NOG95470.1 DUF1987 domain-containing protein [Bacteroidota bacterium]
MEHLNIEGTPKTPTIKFDVVKGELLIRGRSIPENSIEFYKPLVDMLEAYTSKPLSNTKVDVQLEYFNTSSSKCILDIFKRLEVLNSNGSNVIINWHYEEDDEDMLEAGEDYQAIISVPFKMIQINEE